MNLANVEARIRARMRHGAPKLRAGLTEALAIIQDAQRAADRFHPLKPASIPRDSDEDRAARVTGIARSLGVDHNVVARCLDDIDANDDVWLSRQYQVNARAIDLDYPNAPPIVHLSIKRTDKLAAHDWRHFQAIKNQIVGDECEGVELYPAESRIVDTSNQYHLWVCTDPTFRFPFGWNEGRRVSNVSGGGSRQRAR